jgi:hypothetical protein
MKILLDENLNWRLERFFGHACASVSRIGWAGVKNGQLLQQAAAAGFEALISMDASLSTQQNLGNLRLSIIVLRASSNRLDDTPSRAAGVGATCHAESGSDCNRGTVSG